MPNSACLHLLGHCSQGSDLVLKAIIAVMHIGVLSCNPSIQQPAVTTDASHHRSSQADPEYSEFRADHSLHPEHVSRSFMRLLEWLLEHLEYSRQIGSVPGNPGQRSMQAINTQPSPPGPPSLALTLGRLCISPGLKRLLGQSEGCLLPCRLALSSRTQRSSNWCRS